MLLVLQGVFLFLLCEFGHSRSQQQELLAELAVFLAEVCQCSQ